MCLCGHAVWIREWYEQRDNLISVLELIYWQSVRTDIIFRTGTYCCCCSGGWRFWTWVYYWQSWRMHLHIQVNNGISQVPFKILMFNSKLFSGALYFMIPSISMFLHKKINVLFLSNLMNSSSQQENKKIVQNWVFFWYAKVKKVQFSIFLLV